MLVIRWLFAAHVAGPWIFQSHGLNTANVDCSRDISLHCTVGERTRQWVARHLPCRCLENEPSAEYAARFGDNAGCHNFRTHGLNTAKVGSLRAFCLHVATRSNRHCGAVYSGDSTCPLVSWVRGLYIAKVRVTLSHMHVRVTSTFRCCLAAHSRDNDCLWIFLTHGCHFAAGLGRHVRQWTAQCAPRESLVNGLDALSGGSQCVAGLHQARGPGGVTAGQSSMPCRRHGEREDALSEPYAGPFQFVWQRIKWVVNRHMLE